MASNSSVLGAGGLGFVFVVCSVFILSACNAQSGPSTIRDLSWLPRSDQKASSKQYFVISFGASWCEPCKKEIPAWNRLAKEFQGKAITFILVNVDEDESVGRAFIAELNPDTMRVVYDSAHKIVPYFGPKGLPTTYVLDSEGKVLFIHAGFERGDETLLRTEIQKHLSTAASL